MKIGYARVSTQDQNLDRQLDALKGAGCEKIFQEKITGTKKDRSELERLLEQVRKGDTIVIESLSRLSRSTKDLIQLMETFNQEGVNLYSMKENIDTTGATGKLIFKIFGALVEFERDLISERTKEGLASARARGRKGGRPKKTGNKIEVAIKMYQSKEYTVKEIEEATGVSKATLYRRLKGE